MENEKPILEKAGEVYGYLEQYAKKRMELFKLDLTEQIAKVISSLLTYILLISILGMVVIFSAVALGFLLGEWLGSMAGGFAVVAIGFTLFGLLLFVLRKRLILSPVLRIVIDSMHDIDENN
jgi:hypothetical protein